jgi:lipoprotein-anchoring transpeptidase ErfK/SrfK
MQRQTMKKILLIIILFITLLNAENFADFNKTHSVNIKALSATKFELTDENFENPKIVDLTGKDFFVASVREPGSDGRIYAVDRDGTIWWSGEISSGAGGGHETDNNIFHILSKKRFHMSTKYPSADGVNNMDFTIKFTPDGQALHLGNIKAMSYGCIHVAEDDIRPLYKWSEVGMPIVILRGKYVQFLNQEIYEFEKEIEEYDKKTKK